MLDYLEGANHCQVNSDRLQTSAHIILKDDDGGDSYGLFLYHIAYEEIAKAIFCLFVHYGLVKEGFIDQVFRDHKAKIFLFEEIIRNFKIDNGVAYLDGMKLGEKPLSYFISKHDSIISKHRTKTNNFLYVRKTDNWEFPSVSIPDIEKEEKEIKSKIGALELIFEFLKNELSKTHLTINNIQFYEKDGNFTIQYDTI